MCRGRWCGLAGDVCCSPYSVIGNFSVTQTISLNGGFVFGIDWYILPTIDGNVYGLLMINKHALIGVS